MAATAMSMGKRVATGTVLIVLGCGTTWLIESALQRWRTGDQGLAITLAVGAVAVGCTAGVIALIAWASHRAKDTAADIAARRNAAPEQPWLWRREWAEGRIEHEVPWLGLAVLWGFAMVWTTAVVGGGAAVHLDRGLDTEPGAAVVLALFALVGLFLVTKAVGATVHRFKYGRSVLELRSVPGVLGGELALELRPPPALPPDAELTMVLDCIRRVSRPDHTDFVSLEWRIEKRVVGGGGAAIPVTFDVPFDCPGSTPDGSPERVRIGWRLSVSAALPGIDYGVGFEVPVFETEASDPARVKGVVTSDDRSLLAPPLTRIRILPLPSGGIRVTYPAPGWLVGWLVASTLPLAIAGGIAWLSEHRGVELVTTLAVGGGLSAAVLVFAVLGVVMHLTRLEVLPDTVAIVRGLGRFVRTSRVARHEIHEIVFDGLQSGRRMTFHVELRTEAGGSRTVATDLRSEDEARWLTAELQRWLQTEPSSRIRSS